MFSRKRGKTNPSLRCGPASQILRTLTQSRRSGDRHGVTHCVPTRMILETETHSSTVETLDLDLIRKYSVPGPRYTSYPPATQFTTELESLGLMEAIERDSAPGAGPISLYFHLPFCESRCWFCGCTTVITRRRDSAGEYLDDLVREVKLTAARMDCSRPVTQVHFGGGTPTFFPPDQLRRLGAVIAEYFPNRVP